jgi:hypothetical protein
VNAPKQQIPIISVEIQILKILRGNFGNLVEEGAQIPHTTVKWRVNHGTIVSKDSGYFEFGDQ